jgi:hypothetical protein
VHVNRPVGRHDQPASQSIRVGLKGAVLFYGATKQALE